VTESDDESRPLRQYREPASHKEARFRLNGSQNEVLAHIMKLFRKARDGQAVSTTGRQIAKALKLPKRTVDYAIQVLIREGFIVRLSPGGNDREPSKYRLTVWECNGEPATEDYVRKLEHHRNRPKRKAKKPPLLREQLADLNAKIDRLLSRENRPEANY
jgi:DNA-binding MarR family transcriptional regulator